MVRAAHHKPHTVNASSIIQGANDRVRCEIIDWMQAGVFLIYHCGIGI
jgi:hypothetical protein